MIVACSHMVLVTNDVLKMTKFYKNLFEIEPYYENEMFSEFVFPSKFRIALFKPVGKAAKFFSVMEEKSAHGVGITVDDVEAFYDHVINLSKNWEITLSGPPKDHPWGEKSFLLIDPEKRRWEITRSPSKDGMLVPKSFDG